MITHASGSATITMELFDLEQLVALKKYGTLSHAAEMLHLTQTDKTSFEDLLEASVLPSNLSHDI